jgi:hypothetical protein
VSCGGADSKSNQLVHIPRDENTVIHRLGSDSSEWDPMLGKGAIARALAPSANSNDHDGNEAEERRAVDP